MKNQEQGDLIDSLMLSQKRHFKLFVELLIQGQMVMGIKAS